MASSFKKQSIASPFKNEFDGRKSYSPPKKMTFHQAHPDAAENLQKRMSFVPDLKKRTLNPHYNGIITGKFPYKTEGGVSENAEDFLNEYKQRRAVRDNVEDQVDRNKQLHLDGDNIVRLLNRDNKDIQSIPRAKDPILGVNVKRQSLIENAGLPTSSSVKINDMLDTYATKTTTNVKRQPASKIGQGVTRT